MIACLKKGCRLKSKMVRFGCDGVSATNCPLAFSTVSPLSNIWAMPTRFSRKTQGCCRILYRFRRHDPGNCSKLCLCQGELCVNFSLNGGKQSCLLGPQYGGQIPAIERQHNGCNADQQTEPACTSIKTVSRPLIPMLVSFSDRNIRFRSVSTGYIGALYCKLLQLVQKSLVKFL